MGESVSAFVAPHEEKERMATAGIAGPCQGLEARYESIKTKGEPRLCTLGLHAGAERRAYFAFCVGP